MEFSRELLPQSPTLAVRIISFFIFKEILENKRKSE